MMQRRETAHTGAEAGRHKPVWPARDLGGTRPC